MLLLDMPAARPAMLSFCVVRSYPCSRFGYNSEARYDDTTLALICVMPPRRTANNKNAGGIKRKHENSGNASDVMSFFAKSAKFGSETSSPSAPTPITEAETIPGDIAPKVKASLTPTLAAASVPLEATQLEGTHPAAAMSPFTGSQSPAHTDALEYRMPYPEPGHNPKVFDEVMHEINAELQVSAAKAKVGCSVCVCGPTSPCFGVGSDVFEHGPFEFWGETEFADEIKILSYSPGLRGNTTCIEHSQASCRDLCCLRPPHRLCLDSMACDAPDPPPVGRPMFCPTQTLKDRSHINFTRKQRFVRRGSRG